MFLEKFQWVKMLSTWHWYWSLYWGEWAANVFCLHMLPDSFLLTFLQLSMLCTLICTLPCSLLWYIHYSLSSLLSWPFCECLQAQYWHSSSYISRASRAYLVAIFMIVIKPSHIPFSWFKKGIAREKLIVSRIRLNIGVTKWYPHCCWGCFNI